jgi:hypothetical protein
MLEKESSKVAFAEAKAFRQCLYLCAIAVESSIVNQSECAGDCI